LILSISLASFPGFLTTFDKVTDLSLNQYSSGFKIKAVESNSEFKLLDSLGIRPIETTEL
jgi:hypothetical protein